MPIFAWIFFIGFGVMYLGLCGLPTAKFVGVGLMAIGVLGTASLAARRRERDRRADAADARALSRR